MIENFGTTADGQTVQRIALEDGLRMDVLTIGAVIQRLEAPDRAGRVDNIVLGLPTVEDYVHRSPHFGAATGRFAGRIRGARFTLDGVEYHLPKNDGDNCLHGGPAGFGRRVWTVDEAARSSVRLRYVSADGEAGFPGRLTTTVTYTIAGQTLRIDYEAVTDKATVLNLTNHSYFNLAGEGSGNVDGHELTIAANRVLEQDAQSLPTGGFLPVEATPFDFRDARTIGARIREAHPQIVFGLGYDQCFVLDGAGLRHVATLRDPASGRSMEVWTDEPAVQLYTSNKLTGSLTGLSGRTFRQGDAVCLETQHFPDAPNQPHFPSTVLRPGEVFRSTTEYRFAAE